MPKIIKSKSGEDKYRVITNLPKSLYDEFTAHMESCASSESELALLCIKFALSQESFLAELKTLAKSREGEVAEKKKASEAKLRAGELRGYGNLGILSAEDIKHALSLDYDAYQTWHAEHVKPYADMLSKARAKVEEQRKSKAASK